MKAAGVSTIAVMALTALGVDALSPSLAGASDATLPLAEFSDCAECPVMVALPAGRFQMGATPKERTGMFAAFAQAALPQHEVVIDYSFAIGKFEVTVGQFDHFVQETGASVGGVCGIRLAEQGPLARKVEGTVHPDHDPSRTGPFYVEITDGSYTQPGLPVTEDQPAVCVSRNEIKAYLAWLSDKTERAYRLPTEAEWDYAARAGTQTVAFFGDDLADACDYANFGDRASGYQAGMAAPCAEAIQPLWTANVGSYEPNAWGLHDMAGNVQEALEDCWFDTHDGAPGNGSPRMRDDCQLFIARGGDYQLMHVSMTASERLFFGYVPESAGVQGADAAFNGRSNLMGFRVAISLDDQAWDRQ